VRRRRNLAIGSRTVSGPDLQQLQGFRLRAGERVKRPIAKSRRQYALQSPALEIARELKGIRSSPFPGFIQPALATLHAKPPSGDRWVHEIKLQA
jgi:ATP-dependent DNA ligase